VKAEHDSPYGMIRSAWRRQGGGLRLEVEGPVNTSATVFLPIRPDVTNVVADVAPTTSDRNRMRFKVGLREIHL
jgi:hypothetical protein